MSVRHAPGERCPVLELAYATFGRELGADLLLEFTCFPFDDDQALTQLQVLVDAEKEGRLQETIDRIQAEQDEAFKRLAARS